MAFIGLFFIMIVIPAAVVLLLLVIGAAGKNGKVIPLPLRILISAPIGIAAELLLTAVGFALIQAVIGSRYTAPMMIVFSVSGAVIFPAAAYFTHMHALKTESSTGTPDTLERMACDTFNWMFITAVISVIFEAIISFR